MEVVSFSFQTLSSENVGWGLILSFVNLLDCWNLEAWMLDSQYNPALKPKRTSRKQDHQTFKTLEL